MLIIKDERCMNDLSILYSRLIGMLGDVFEIRAGSTKFFGTLTTVVESQEDGELAVAVAVEGFGSMLTIDETSAIAVKDYDALEVLYDPVNLFTAGEYN